MELRINWIGTLPESRIVNTWTILPMNERHWRNLETETDKKIYCTNSLLYRIDARFTEHLKENDFRVTMTFRRGSKYSDKLPNGVATLSMDKEFWNKLNFIEKREYFITSLFNMCNVKYEEVG